MIPTITIGVEKAVEQKMSMSACRSLVRMFTKLAKKYPGLDIGGNVCVYKKVETPKEEQQCVTGIG